MWDLITLDTNTQCATYRCSECGSVVEVYYYQDSITKYPKCWRCESRNKLSSDWKYHVQLATGISLSTPVQGDTLCPYNIHGKCMFKSNEERCKYNHEECTLYHYISRQSKR